MELLRTEKWVTCRNGNIAFGDETYETKEEAIMACKDDKEDAFVGRVNLPRFTEEDVYIKEDIIIKDMQDILYNAVGDGAEFWELTAEDELELGKRIRKAVIDFLNETGNQPKGFVVEDVEEV